MDFEKAFDTPPHELLKSKLFSYGIGGKTLKWINAFLCYRQQRVVVNGVKSDWAPVVSGTLEGAVLEKVDSIKYLGVTITNDLRWNTHISNICTKANRTLGFMRRTLFSCPQNVKGAAYKSMVRPILEYGSSVWDPHPDKLQEELEKVQNRAARFVTRNYVYETGSMTGILGQLKWESLKKRRKDNRLILLYKGLKGKARIPTDDLIPKTRRGRNQHSLAFQIPSAS